MSDTQFKVSVIDSSLFRHADDQRPPGKTGVGKGAILLQYEDGVWKYSFAGTDFYTAPHISVLRLNV